MFRIIATGLIFISTLAGAQDVTRVNAWPELDQIDARSLTAAAVEDLAEDARAHLARRKARASAADMAALEAVQAHALMPEADADFEPDVAPRARSYRTECATGGAGACIELALLYRKGVGVWIDHDLGDAMLTLWCRRGQLSACLSDVEFDKYAPIMPTLTKGCMEKSAAACHRLSSIYAYGEQDVERDTALAKSMAELALAYAEPACMKGDALAKEYHLKK